MIRRSLVAGAVAMLVVPALAGCEAGLNAPTLQFHPAAGGKYDTVNGITISNAFVLAAPSGSALPAGSQAGLFLGLWNGGTGTDTLTSVTAKVASSATITGGPVALPVGTSVNLTGPAPQIVLNGLTAPLSGGQNVDVTLTFASAGPVSLDVPVEPQSYSYSDLSQPPSPTPSPTPTAVVPTATPRATPTPSAKPRK